MKTDEEKLKDYDKLQQHFIETESLMAKRDAKLLDILFPEEVEQLELFKELGKLWGSTPTKNNPRWRDILDEFIIIKRPKV